MEWNGNEGIWDSVFPVLGGAVVKNPPANAGDTQDTGLIPGLARSLGKGNGNSLQCSFLLKIPQTEEPTVHGVAKSQTQLRD